MHIGHHVVPRISWELVPCTSPSKFFKGKQRVIQDMDKSENMSGCMWWEENRGKGLRHLNSKIKETASRMCREQNMASPAVQQ